ncbi:MAG: T9SS type A sorting domain-containing protein [Hymenobacteraceae bacterium]|nr:T9SS type A sorting domain-containing protein [Hymenobacteraceae bacterium]
MMHVRLAALRRLGIGFLLSALAVVSRPVCAQRPVGQWELIAPGTSASRLVEANNVLYVAGDFGLFRYDLTDNTVRPLSKQDGFADVRVAALAYDSTTGLVVIGYRDTNIDLLDPRTGTIANVPDIQRRTIVGSKFISSITTHAGRAYVACSFGIVVVDLRRVEVADTYANLSRDGQPMEIRSVAILGDSIIASTRSESLIVGQLSRNLLDYRNWAQMPNMENAPAVAVFNQRFYAVRDDLGLFRLADGSWRGLPGGSPTKFEATSLTAARGVLTIARPTESGFSILYSDGRLVDVRPPGIGNVTQVLLGRDGRYYLADRTNGLLITDANGAAPTVVAPNGPSTDVSFFTLSVGADVYAFAGGYNSGTAGFGRRPGFAHRQNGRWRMYSKATVPAGNYPVDRDRDLSAAAWNPVNQKLYIASYGNGLIEWSGPDVPARRFGWGTSPLISTDGLGEEYTRLTSVAVDAAGVVWTTNFHQVNGQPGLFSFDPAATANPFRAHLAGVLGADAAHQVVIDDNGYKWITRFPSRLAGSSVYGFVYNSGDGKYRTLSSEPANGGILGPIYAIAKDRKGDMWIGTTKGVQVFYNTSAAFNTSYTASQPIIDRRPLLDNQLVKVIAVDGANRKWIGTDDGLYLFGEDGDETIAHFTAENSPLPSNAVNSISINGVTGEVFVGTDNGLISYRGNATEPSTEEKPACTTVFPNPVPARFTGQIAIDGLTGGAIVKITDIAGQLVYETTANGSRAVWNARDYNGRRVRTGIYLAYASTPDGQNTCVSKIAVMGE